MWDHSVGPPSQAFQGRDTDQRDDRPGITIRGFAKCIPSRSARVGVGTCSAIALAVVVLLPPSARCPEARLAMHIGRVEAGAAVAEEVEGGLGRIDTKQFRYPRHEPAAGAARRVISASRRSRCSSSAVIHVRQDRARDCRLALSGINRVCPCIETTRRAGSHCRPGTSSGMRSIELSGSIF